MQKVQKTYTPEFKREAVRLAQSSGKPIAQVARELGMRVHLHPSMAQRID
jgi:transposase